MDPWEGTMPGTPNPEPISPQLPRIADRVRDGGSRSPRVTTAVLRAGAAEVAARNHGAARRFAPLADTLESVSRDAYLRLVGTEGFADFLARVPDAFTVAGLEADLGDILGGPVDLVVLDAASPMLAMEVLRSHRVLAMRDPEAFETFTVRTIMAYFDLKRVREPIERAILSRETES